MTLPADNGAASSNKPADNSYNNDNNKAPPADFWPQSRSARWAPAAGAGRATSTCGLPVRLGPARASSARPARGPQRGPDECNYIAAGRGSRRRRRSRSLLIA